VLGAKLLIDLATPSEVVARLICPALQPKQEAQVPEDIGLQHTALRRLSKDLLTPGNRLGDRRRVVDQGVCNQAERRCLRGARTRIPSRSKLVPVDQPVRM